MNATSKSLINIHVAIFLFSLVGLFAKLMPLPLTLMVLGRVFFASIFLYISIFYNQQSLKLNSNQDYLKMSLMGVLLAIHFTTFFQSVKVSTVAIGVITFATFPIFVSIIEPWFFNERFNIMNVISAVITLFGVILVIGEFQLESNVTQGALWGIASSFSFAVLSLLNRKYVKEYSNLVVAYYQDLGATVVLLPCVFMYHGQTVNVTDILLLIVLGVVFTGFSHSLFIKGLTNVKTHTASIIASLEPVYAIAIASVLIGEIPSYSVILGGILILSLTMYTTVLGKKEDYDDSSYISEVTGRC